MGPFPCVSTSAGPGAQGMLSAYPANVRASEAQDGVVAPADAVL